MKSSFVIPRVKKFEEYLTKNEKERNRYIEKGWQPFKKGDFRLSKEKEGWLMFEEEVYLFFKDALQFSVCEHNVRLGQNQVDLIAGVDDVLLVIECKTKEEPGLKKIKSYIRTVAGKQKSIDRAIHQRYGKRFKTIKHILVLRDIDYSVKDQEYARASDVYIWGEKYFSIMQHLYTVLGPMSRYYFLKELDVPKIKIKEGRSGSYYTTALRLRTKDGLTVYHFLLLAKDLIKLAYVARIENGKPEMYQRLVSKSRLNQIAEKFLKLGNTFKNNIIVSLETLPKSPKVLKTAFIEETDTEKIDVVELGIPKEYVSLWVIDGQHRLFSFTRTPDLAKERHLLVTAIEDIHNSDQANTFVEINQNQKPVDSNVLWDLFDSLRPNTKWGAISKLVKHLNTSSLSIFHSKIYIPGSSRRMRSSYNLFFSNFCKGLLDRKILDEDTRVGLFHLFKGQGYNDEGMILVAKEINRFFALVSLTAKRAKKESWVNGFILTNNGLNVFLRVYAQCLVYYANKIDYNDLEKLFSKSLKKFFFERSRDINDLRKSTSSEGSREDVAYQIIFRINQSRHSFAERYIISKNKDQKVSDVYVAYASLEKALRKFIEKKLNKLSANWWNDRMPDDVRQIAEEKFSKGLSSSPFTSYKPKKKMECLDFMDYPRIITRADNWRDAFKIYFKDEEAVRSRFREMKDIRNKIAHPADLDDEERQEFISFCNKIIKITKK